MRNIFDQDNTEELKSRIGQLTPETKGLWGTMEVSQMLAHCCVTYEMAYEDKHKRPSPVLRFFLKLLIKNGVVGEKPYPKNSRTAPGFIITDKKDFEVEKKRLLDYVDYTFQLGADHFEGLESFSFGPITSKEWSNLFYKHLDHHLRQFGV